jgi:hypothetical protein
MMRRWLISVPVWGSRYVDIFCSTALPALRAAVAHLADDVRLVVHTDQASRIADVAGNLPVEPRPVPGGFNWSDSLSRAHRDVLAMACQGDVVVPLAADMVMSEGALVACRGHLAHGKKLIACAGMRVLDQGAIPKSYTGAELLAWGWANRHPMTRECTWPLGNSKDVSRLYFENGENVACRLYLPHPLAVLVDGRPIHFHPTIDANAINNFSASDIHLVTDPNDLAVVELSPADKGFETTAPLGERLRELRCENAMINPMHRWLLTHRIVIRGANEDCGDDYVAGQMVANQNAMQAAEYSVDAYRATESGGRA